jgi:hypothetical protein
MQQCVGSLTYRKVVGATCMLLLLLVDPLWLSAVDGPAIAPVSECQCVAADCCC